MISFGYCINFNEKIQPFYYYRDSYISSLQIYILCVGECDVYMIHAMPFTKVVLISSNYFVRDGNILLYIFYYNILVSFILLSHGKYG